MSSSITYMPTMWRDVSKALLLLVFVTCVVRIDYVANFWYVFLYLSPSLHVYTRQRRTSDELELYKFGVVCTNFAPACTRCRSFFVYLIKLFLSLYKIVCMRPSWEKVWTPHSHPALSQRCHVWFLWQRALAPMRPDIYPPHSYRCVLSDTNLLSEGI